MKIINNYNGILFVGDPHLWTKKPGRRLDESFLETVIRKLTEAVEIANKNNLFLVILGDLLHDDKDHSPEMIVKLIGVLNKLNHKAVTILGNHEKTDKFLSVNNAMSILIEANIIDTIETASHYCDFVWNKKTFSLFGIPYGEKLYGQKYPKKSTKNLLITHHDVSFPGAYPGAVEMKEIKNIDNVINGHMHNHYEPVAHGKTTWFNPGNITRVTIAEKNNIPRVWEYNFDKENFSAHALTFHQQIFDETGYQIESNKTTPSEINFNKSEFVKLLKEQNNEVNVSDDAITIKEDLDIIFNDLKPNEHVKSDIFNILNQVLQDSKDSV